MAKIISLFKLENEVLIPTEIFQSKPTVDLQYEKNKYDSFKIGNEAKKYFETAFKKNLHYYKFFKQDVKLSPSVAKKVAKEWKSFPN